MNFLSPLALGLFALSLPLVLLYFLKVRRRERMVPSLLLWETSLRDREASAFRCSRSRSWPWPRWRWRWPARR